MAAERFILFSAGGEEFACCLQEISEVMEPQESFPIPRAPRHFTGLFNFHGSLTALVDLGLYLGREGQSATGKVLVVDTRRAQLALTVDGVSSIFTGETIPCEEPGAAPLTGALLETESGRVRVLSLEALIWELEQGL